MSYLGVTSSFALFFVLFGFTGCGEKQVNKLRPAAPLKISVVVQSDVISISPTRIGAGPTQFLISNQSGTTVAVTLSGEGVERNSPSIANSDTDEFQVRLKPGNYQIRETDDIAATPAQLTVTSERPSAQDYLLLP